MPATDGSTPAEALHLILAAATFDHTAKASATWAPNGDHERATTMFSGLAELIRTELVDPRWPTQPATLDAVTRVSRAYQVAANTVRRTDPAAELGYGEIKRQGCTYAADWLQAQADTFAVIAAELAERQPQSGHQGRAKFIPANDSGQPAVEFSTLAVVQNDPSELIRIDVTIHRDEAEATAYFGAHADDRAPLHRVDTHTIGLTPDSRPDEAWLQDGAEVEFETLAVLHNDQLDVTVHASDTAAYAEFAKRYTGPEVAWYQIDSHRIPVGE